MPLRPAIRPTLCFALAAGLAVSLSACAPTRPPAGAEPPVPVTAPANLEIRLADRVLRPLARRPEWPALLAGAETGHRHLIVQLRGVPTLAQRQILAESGIELLQPISGSAYYARVDPARLDSLQLARMVRWAGKLAADDKIAATLRDPGRSEWAHRDSGRLDLVVRLFEGTDFQATLDQARALGGKIGGTVPQVGVFAVTLPADRLDKLADIDAVRRIQPALPPGVDESERARTYVGTAVGAIPAGDPTGQGVRVGVFEGRHAQTNHPDFGVRVSKGDTGTTEFSGHPTMSMGMILGDGTRSVAEGAASANQWRGVAPQAEGRTYNYTTSADYVVDYIGDVTDAVENDGVDLLNNAWGDAGCGTNPYGAYVGRAPFLDGVIAGDLGRRVPILFSVGNERDGYISGGVNRLDCIGDGAAPFNNYGTLNHPKSAKNLITVGAMDSGNAAMSTYSSWGPTVDGRIKPDVVAAGHHNGTLSSNTSEITNPFGTPTGAANQQDYRIPIFDSDPAPPLFVYGWFAQTSAAVAEVTGGLALMLEAWRDTFPGRADPLPSTLKATLVDTAVDLNQAGVAWLQPGPDYATGYGRVDIDEAVASIERGDAIEGSVAHGGSAQYFRNVAAGAGALRITLAWDDAAAIDGADPALVNDLDLVVTGPGGARHYPWTLNPLLPATAAVRTVENHRDNLEQVLIDTPAAGDWSIEVRGTSVAAGRQNFSLVTRNGFTRQPADLLLALDTSDSMNSLAAPGGQPRIAVLRQAVQLLLDTWNLHALPSDRIGFAAFGDNVSTTPAGLPALQPLQANYASMSTAAAGLSATGCTALGGALQVAFDSFDPASPNKRSILVVTDGMHSTNPFVGETGAPSRLRVANYTPASPPPFGGFFCNSGTATGPGGAAIVPDGIDVRDHDVEIHAIGIGVNGAGFQQLVERLASENDGIHHLTTTPDSELDLLYINDLVRALKSNTLEVIESDSSTLSAGSTRYYDFPANSTLSSVTLVLSWRNALEENLVQVEMRDHRGAIIAPADAHHQAFSSVLRYDLPPAAPGQWRLALRQTKLNNLGYQMSLIGDESCLHYAVTAPEQAEAGMPFSFQASVSEAGRTLARPVEIKARLLAPAVDANRILAEAIPRTRAGREYLEMVKAQAWKKLPPAGAVIEAAIAELLEDPKLVARLSQREPIGVPIRPLKVARIKPALLGETRYTSGPLTPAIAGAYQLDLQLRGETACGPVQRRESIGVAVGFGEVSAQLTRFERLQGIDKTVQLAVRPVDAAGNLLGPGNAARVSLKVEGLKPATPVIDLLDGRYLRVYEGREAAITGIRLGVDRTLLKLPHLRIR